MEAHPMVAGKNGDSKVDGLHHRRAKAIKISVIKLNHQIITLDVLPTKSVGSVMAMVNEEGINQTLLYLEFDGEKLQVHRTLEEYNIKENSTLTVRKMGFERAEVKRTEASSRKDMHQVKQNIFVKSFTKTISLECYPFLETVGDIIEKIKTKERMDWPDLELEFGGKWLNKDKNLASYGIQRDSTLKLMTRIRGGDMGNQLELQMTKTEIGIGIPSQEPKTISPMTPTVWDRCSDAVKELRDKLSTYSKDLKAVCLFTGSKEDLVKANKCWYDYSRKMFLFAISMFFVYLGSPLPPKKVPLLIFSAAFVMVDIAIMWMPRWANALVCSSWLLMVVVYCLLLVPFNKLYSVAAIPMLLVFTTWAFPQLQQESKTTPQDEQLFDSIFDLSSDIVNSGGMVTSILGYYEVGPVGAVGILSALTITFGLYLMMVTTVRRLASADHTWYLAITLKILVMATLIATWFHVCSKGNK